MRMETTSLKDPVHLLIHDNQKQHTRVSISTNTADPAMPVNAASQSHKSIKTQTPVLSKPCDCQKNYNDINDADCEDICDANHNNIMLSVITTSCFQSYITTSRCQLLSITDTDVKHDCTCTDSTRCERDECSFTLCEPTARFL